MNNFWKNKRVFITGANGFLGAHLTKSLVEKGVRPFVLIFEENPGGIFDEERLANKTRVIRGDILDLKLIRKILKENKIDTIFHLAAQAAVDQAVDNPLQTFETNIGGTWNILEASRNSKTIKRIIVASSDKAYGHHDVLPYEEHTHPLKGIYPYEVSKTCADLITQSYWKTFNLPVCITRCTNLYGPGDLKFSRIVPNTINLLHKRQSPIIRDNGSTLRDYLYVEDAAEAYIRLAEKMNKKIFGHAFNFSTNIPISAQKAIGVISSAMRRDIAPKIIRTKGFEIKNQYASYVKAKTLLQWKPQHNFVEGVKKTIPWYLQYLKNNSPLINYFD